MASSSLSLAANQTLKLYFVHTGERAAITFKRDGKYDPKGLAQINRFLRDWRKNEPTKMDPELLDLVWEVHKRSGSGEYIHVVSAYRSPETNSMLRERSINTGVAKRSQHMLGKAMDFYIPGVKLATLRAIGMQMQIGGVGFYPTSGSPFVHMDVGNVRAWPRMSRQELAKLFPDGRTLHRPADGRPLPGYYQAVAELERKPAAGTVKVMDDDDTPISSDLPSSLVTAMLPVPKTRAQAMIERQLNRFAGIDEELTLKTVPIPGLRPLADQLAVVSQPVVGNPAAELMSGVEKLVPSLFFTEARVSIASYPMHGTAVRSSAGFNGQGVSISHRMLPPPQLPATKTRSFELPPKLEAAIEPARGHDRTVIEQEQFDAGRFWSEG